MRQFPDKAHRVTDDDIQRVTDGQQARRGVEGVEKAVVGGDCGACQAVQERRLPRVRVAHYRRDRDFTLFAILVYELLGPLLTREALIRSGDITPKPKAIEERRENRLKEVLSMEEKSK